MVPAKPRPQPLQLIRLSLLAGVLMFGAVTLLVHRQPTWQAKAVSPIMGYALVLFAIVAVSVAMVLKGRVGREPDPERRGGLLVIGWSIGEAAGLFGAVLFFLTGQGQWYVFGLLAMLCAFVLLPVGTGSSLASSLDAR